MGKNPSIKSLLSNVAKQRMAPKGYKNDKDENTVPSLRDDPTNQHHKQTLNIDPIEQPNKETLQLDIEKKPNKSTQQSDLTTQNNTTTSQNDQSGQPNKATQQSDTTNNTNKSTLQEDPTNIHNEPIEPERLRSDLDDTSQKTIDAQSKENEAPDSNVNGNIENTLNIKSKSTTDNATQQSDIINEPFNPTTQIDPTAKPNNATTQNNQTSQPNRATQKDDTNKRPNKTTSRDDISKRPVELTSQVDPTQQNDRSKRPLDSTYRHSKSIPKHDPESRPNKTTRQKVTKDSKSEPQLNLIMGEVKCLKSNQQKKIYQYLLDQGDHVTKKPHISKVTGIPIDSVKRILKLFKDRGLIDHKPVIIKGHGRCTQITILNETADENYRPNRSTQQKDLTARQVDSPSMIDRSDNNIYLSKEEKILRLTDEDIAFDWPNLKGTGFGQHQIKQIVEKLKKKDKSTDNLISSFDHIEFELEKGDLVDKEGNIIGNPCGYIFNALARHGYYRKPVGYISPEEQAAREAAEELKAKKEALKKAQELKFEVWKMELTDEKKAELRQKQPGGNDLNDRYLKSCFLKEVQQAEG